MFHQVEIHLLESEDVRSRREEELRVHGHGIGYDKCTFRAVLTLIGAFMVHLVVGSQYAWGNMAPYFVGYFREQGL